MTIRTACLILSPLIFYVLALNPYVQPGNLDGALYYDLALSLSEDGTYERDGRQIKRFPPGFPVMMALPFRLGLASILTAKLVVIVMAGLGMMLTYLLFRREQFRFPELITVVTWMLPVVMKGGIVIASDVPFLTLSLLFFYMLSHQRNGKRGIGFAVATGVVLGWASLTRWMGVFLGVALIAQVIQLSKPLRERPLIRRYLPEAISSVVGSTIFLCWIVFFIGDLKEVPVIGENPAHRIKSAEMIENPPPQWLEPWLEWKPNDLEGPRDKQSLTLEYYEQPRLARPLFQVSDLLFARIQFTRGANLGRDHPLIFLFYLPPLLIVVGMYCRFRSGGARPSEWCILVYLLLLIWLDWHPLRYWLVTAPFLVAYCFHGGIAIWNRIDRLLPSSIQRVGPCLLLACWLLPIGAVAVHRIFLPHGPRGAYFYPFSSKPEDYYLDPYHGSLWRAGQSIHEDGGTGPTVIVGPERSGLVSRFSGAEIDLYPPSKPPAYLLVAEPHEVPQSLIIAKQLTVLAKHGPITVYRVGPTEPDS